MKSAYAFFLLAIILALALFMPTAGVAQEQSAPPTPAVADTLPAPVINDDAKNVRVFVDKIEVIGTIAKPQALFIIPGRDPKVDGIQIDRSFFREIFRPMEIGRFPRLSRPSTSGNIPW